MQFLKSFKIVVITGCTLAACGPIKKSRLDSVDSIAANFNGKTLLVASSAENSKDAAKVCVEFSSEAGKCKATKKDAKGVISTDTGICDLQIDAKLKYFSLTCNRADGSGCLGDGNGILINGTESNPINANTPEFKDTRNSRTLAQATGTCAALLGPPAAECAPAKTSLAGEMSAAPADPCSALATLPEKLKCKWQNKEIVVQNPSGDGQCYQFSTTAGACKLTQLTAAGVFRDGLAAQCDLVSTAPHSIKIQYVDAPRTIVAAGDATLLTFQFRDTTNAKITIAASGYCMGAYKQKKDPVPFGATASTITLAAAPKTSNPGTATTTATKTQTTTNVQSGAPAANCKPAPSSPAKTTP